MTNFKQCNRCATDCEHRGAIRVCECGKYTKLEQAVPKEAVHLTKCTCCGKRFILKRSNGES